MYHRSNNGISAQYADIDGYVSERGDNFEDFNFDLHDYNPDDQESVDYYRDEWFPQFVEECAVATKERQRELDEFRS